MTGNAILQSAETAAALARVDERIKNLEGRLSTAHKRIDGLEKVVREDLKGIHDALQPLRDWMNQGKGGMVLLLAGGGIGGGAIGALLTRWLAS